jgi:hypothetical protein
MHLDLKDWDGDISRLSDEQLDKFLVEIEKRAALQMQQQAALPARKRSRNSSDR